MKQKLILNEELFLEGKNLQKTFDQYRRKLIDSDTGEEFDSDEEAYDYYLSIISIDPTYVQGSSTTGDYGIWLLNQELKGNLDKFRIQHHFEIPISDILTEFIEKKSNLEKKDINQYKTPEDLYNVLQQTELSARQKERKIRKDIKGAKKVGSTKYFDIYIPETYEASCALGKGSGWCTADSRTREYYDAYLKRFGGQYYIAISKDGKYRYQIHFESSQFSAAGTNPDINTPNEEVMLDYNELIEQWPELNDFFEVEIDQILDVAQFLNRFLLNQWGVTRFNWSVPYDELETEYGIDSFYTQYLEGWIYPERISYKLVAQPLLDNPDLTMKIVTSFTNENKKYANALDNEDLKKLIITAFKSSIDWGKHGNLIGNLIDEVFGTDGQNYIIQPSVRWPDEVDVSLSVSRIVEHFMSYYHVEDELEEHDYNKKQTIDFLKKLLDDAGLLDRSTVQKSALSLCKNLIQEDCYDIPGLPNKFFDNNEACQVFFTEFNQALDNLFIARGDKELGDRL